MRKSASIDMVHGPLLGKILMFSIPLMAANVLQVLFNTMDTIIVGQFAGYTSLAAVGSTTAIIALFINSFIAVSIGINVVIAKYIGMGGRENEISRAVHTAIAVGIVGGIAVGGLGILTSTWLLDATSVPADIRDQALLYLRIYFAGTVFNVVYNFGAAIIRAKGDTQRPLIYLTVSGVVNVVLNLIFVIVFSMDVAGVALATIISQAISAAMILIQLMRETDVTHFSWNKLCFDRHQMAEMARIGVPSWVQAILFSISNVVIQGAINSYDSVVVAGCSAGINIESFMYYTMNAICQACQTFASQNLGAGRIDRVRRVVQLSVGSVLVWGIFQSAAVALFAGPLVNIYNSDPAVIEAGVYRLRCVASLYFVYGVSDVLMGAIRGCGVAVAPMLINLLCSCVLRVVLIGLLDTSKVGIGWVYAIFTLSWFVLVAMLTPFWIHLRHKLEREHAPEPHTA